MSIDLSWVSAQFPDLRNVAMLSQGGQKIVLSAGHPQHGHVVLKIIHPSQDASSVKREILSTQKIKSGRIPKIYATGQLQSPLGLCIWLLEQRILGMTLRECLCNGAFSSGEVLKLGIQILEVIVQAEAEGIVHRDIKPENIMRDTQGEYWLLDFGIARHLQLYSLTPTMNPFGKFKPGYAPPEQYKNIKTDIDNRADLFALGVTLYECATGSNPFISGTRDVVETLQRVDTISFPALNISCSFSGTCGAMNDFICTLTQKRRDRRVNNAKEALDWVNDIISKEGLSSQP